MSFLLTEALNSKAHYSQNGSFLLKINPSIKSSYSVITKENEITRYSITATVNYLLIDKKTDRVYIQGKETATSDYSAAVTYTGVATEVAREDTYKRLAETIAEKIHTQIIIRFRQKI
tara:strand:+ start:981 stop:1334 length:354 start_codon:yes stop_codon:yes gene_type:complete